MLKRFLVFIFLFLFSFQCFAFGETPEQICSSTKCYEIVEKIGQGAFSYVYKVSDSKGQFYAIKAYRNFEKKTEFESYLHAKREFERGQLLHHPNIIQSYDFFSDSEIKQPYLVLQFVEGKPLRLFSKGDLSKKRALQAIRQLLNAMEYALLMEFFHLDLHSSNIMLSKNKNLMIVDLASFFTFQEIYETLDTDSTSFLKRYGLLQKTPSKNLKYALASFFSYQFDRLIDRCIEILDTAYFLRSDVIAMRTKMRKIAWHYEMDVEEGVAKPLLHYVQKLKKWISSKQLTLRKT